MGTELKEVIFFIREIPESEDTGETEWKTIFGDEPIQDIEFI